MYSVDLTSIPLEFRCCSVGEPIFTSVAWQVHTQISSAATTVCIVATVLQTGKYFQYNPTLIILVESMLFYVDFLFLQCRQGLFCTVQCILYTMDKGTLKTPNPEYRLYRSFIVWWWSNFLGSESGQKQSVKLRQNMVYSTIQPPPPPTHTHTQPHTVCIYCTFSLGRGGGGRRSERR
jgi:hypothetical protein